MLLREFSHSDPYKQYSEAELLVDEVKGPEAHRTERNAGGRPAGIHPYANIIGHFKCSKKMADVRQL
jgi:hypothetical protein